MDSIGEFTSNIKKSLYYIIQRNSDIIIDTSNKDTNYIDFLENEDMKYHRSGLYCYIIFINNILYEISPFTLISDAKYILDNIENIRYAYNYDTGMDTIIGNIRNICMANRTNEYRYMCFLKETNCVPTIHTFENDFLNKGVKIS